jgi:hypothetical protein
MLAGHPILARVEAPHAEHEPPVRLTTIGVRGIDSFWLPVGGSAELTIVSPDRRRAAIVALMIPEPELRNGAVLSLQVTDASRAPHEQPILSAAPVRVPVQLNRGLNRVQLTPMATAIAPPNPAVTRSQKKLVISSLTLASRY